MNYVYELTYANGCQQWNTQKYKFTIKDMLKAFKKYGVVKVRFHCKLPNGYHLCGCGNMVEGTNQDLLCEECREIYGHDYESEL